MKRANQKYNQPQPSLDLEFTDETVKQEQRPITVLGMTFANDDERRAYFREQLRAKLPDLRHIEGFPIGSDDDIVNLSDPPYYTACPNPWLNDFIAEWEQEKLQLEKEGKRLPNVEVTEPYAADVSEGRSNPVYVAHSYHTKVPHPAIMRYLLHYTQPGDIVLDGFCGTGMTGLAAFLCGNIQETNKLNVKQVQVGGRHAICSDLSPYASFIASNYNNKFDSAQVIDEAKRIYSELEKEIGWIYESTDDKGNPAMLETMIWSESFICPSCGSELLFWENALDFTEKQIREEYPCKNCGATVTKKADKVFDTSFDSLLSKATNTSRLTPVRKVVRTKNGKRLELDVDTHDLELCDKIAKIQFTKFVPSNHLPVGEKTKDPLRSQHIEYAHQFFVWRTLYALSILLDKIEHSKYSVRLKYLFTGLLPRASKMNRFSPQNYFHGGGGWNKGGLNGTLYVPSMPIETSVLCSIKNRLDAIKNIAELVPTSNSNLVCTNSATDLNINSGTIDYIFVDPPFGANLMYSELNFVAESWIKVFTNNATEAIENKSQGKDGKAYRSLMAMCFAEFYRVLKPGRWMTVEFSNTSAAVWNSLQNALQNVGFIISNVSALDKKLGSFNAVTSTTAVKQDLIISCFKPSEQLLVKFEQGAPEGNVWDFIEELLTRLPVHLEHDSKTTNVVERSPKILYDRLISFYVQHGYPVPLNAQEFQAGLKERYSERDGMYFTAGQAAQYDEMRKHTEGFQPSLFFVDSEQGGIAWLNNELATPQTYQELQPKWMQAINGVRKGDILPELIQILEENFIKEDSGKWRRPNLQDDVDLAALREKSLMKEFKAYVEVANKPKGKIKEARVEALRSGFKQAYRDKDFETIVRVGDRIPQSLLQEDEQLLQFYQIATSRI